MWEQVDSLLARFSLVRRSKALDLVAKSIEFMQQINERTKTMLEEHIEVLRKDNRDLHAEYDRLWKERNQLWDEVMLWRERTAGVIPPITIDKPSGN